MMQQRSKATSISSSNGLPTTTTTQQKRLKQRQEETSWRTTRRLTSSLSAVVLVVIALLVLVTGNRFLGRWLDLINTTSNNDKLYQQQSSQSHSASASSAKLVVNSGSKSRNISGNTSSPEELISSPAAITTASDQAAAARIATIATIAGTKAAAAAAAEAAAGGAPTTDTCQVLLDRFHRMNECYRRGRSSCEDDASSPSSFCAAPLLNFAVFEGQGFGRVLEHSTSTCIFGLIILHRPCVVDLTHRDNSYTWRSFINVGTYDWEVSHGPIIDEHYDGNISDAISKLPKIGSGHWERAKNDIRSYTEFASNLTYTNVLPTIVDDRHNASLREIIDEWDGRHSLNGQKILIFPNWGTAWFDRIPVRNSVASQLYLDDTNVNAIDKNNKHEKGDGHLSRGRDEGCSRDKLTTLIQNSMYKPTSLAYALHNERRQTLFGSTSTRYGAIHLRMYMVKTIMNLNIEQVSALIGECLQRPLWKTTHNIDKWWIIADDSTVAEILSKTYENVHHAYTAEFNTFNTHSNRPNARGIFGHQNMAPSVMDWMVLHEAQVAIVTQGAFGDSGARGNGKYRNDICKPFSVFSAPG